VHEPDHLDERLDRVLIGGREPRHVVLVEYDESWPRRFEEHRDRIAAALGTAARRIEHIGSTAVPGLAAKPIVDVLVTVDDVEAEETYRPALEAVGYALRVREPGHRMFRTGPRDVHVHVWPADSEGARRDLLFRDRLRRDATDRALYESAKRALAGRDWKDVNYYAEAKGPVIEEILERAQAREM
jgi:GrpB-like predicted nucleotidyltransferase (UPF0157 family)